MSPVSPVSHCSKWRKNALVRARKRGVSLIELLVVAALIAIVLAVFGTATIKPASAHGLSTASRDLSNLLTLARAEAVRHQTVVRVVFPLEWPEVDSPGRFSHVALWRWDAATSRFKQDSGWTKIPDGVVLEPEMPDYIRNSGYANHDGATIRGDYALRDGADPFEVEILTSDIECRYIEFLPTGAARIPLGEGKRIILVAVEGFEEPAGSGRIVRTNPKDRKRAENWAQVNVETLTGKVQIYRP